MSGYQKHTILRFVKPSGNNFKRTSYPHLYTSLSFTRYCKGHSIYAGPERASYWLQEFVQKISDQILGDGT
jgi:hypothetical protein